MNLFQKYSVLLVLATIFVGATNANAAPLDVDCDLLAAVNETVDDFLNEQGIFFNNLGALVSTAIQDEVVFDQLNALILFFSDGQIDFEGPSQMISTNAKCGLLPQLKDNFND